MKEIKSYFYLKLQYYVVIMYRHILKKNQINNVDIIFLVGNYLSKS